MSILSQILLILFKTHQAGRRPTYFEHVFACSWHVQPDSFERGWAMPWATMLVLVLVLHQRCGVCILFVLFAGCVFVLLPAFHLFLRFSSLVVRIPQQPTPPPRDIMGYFKRFAQEARLLEEPRFAEYPSSALRLSGEGDLPPLNRVPHRGDSHCWSILPLGFSKYGGGSFPELVVCNACASTESTLAHAEFSYHTGKAHSTSNVMHHVESHHTGIAIEYRSAQKALNASSASSAQKITGFFPTTGGSFSLCFLERTLFISSIFVLHSVTRCGFRGGFSA
jgi:hypothetical protein